MRRNSEPASVQDAVCAAYTSIGAGPNTITTKSLPIPELYKTKNTTNSFELIVFGSSVRSIEVIDATE